MSNRGERSAAGGDADGAAASPGRVRQRFEQWSANPRCEANVLSAVSNVRMDRVAERQGLPPSMGQSPFAIAAGNTFESTIFREGAKRLREQLVQQGLLKEGDDGFEDFRTRDKGGPMANPDVAEKSTMEFLRQIGAGGSGKLASRIVAGATITVPDAAMLPRTRLGLDVLLVIPSTTPGKDEPRLPWRLVVGEVKSFVDRGGYTDRPKLAAARAQAGVYVAGLRAVMAALAIPVDRVVVETKGFLVFVRPGGRYPVVYPNEDFAAQATRAEDGFAKMREIARRKPKLGDEGVDAVLAAGRTFIPSCTSFCDLAHLCQKEAFEAGRPSVLGDDMARFVGPVDLHRAYAILEGDNPKTADEKDLARRIAALEALRDR
jgi:hypothetical protein